MKQKFSTIFILLLLFFAGSRVVAQNAPKPFDIEQPSLRVFLPAPELATGRAVVACPGKSRAARLSPWTTLPMRFPMASWWACLAPRAAARAQRST